MRIFRFSAGGLLATRTCAGGVDGGVCMIDAIDATGKSRLLLTA